MQPGRRRVLVVAVAVCAMLCARAAGSAQAGKPVFTSFRTPSGNIGCVYASGSGSPNTLRCDIRSGLLPRPHKPPGCRLAWGDSYSMLAIGRVVLTCHGDTAILPNARILRYGTRWRRGGFTCRSRAVGLRCENRSGHGFFLSRLYSSRF
ncbi:MAG: DUF6636 domain-containing protein [Gaiellaceae bacterium]